MSPSSSTFSSERPATYVWQVTGIAGGLALLLAAIALFGVWSGLAGLRESALLENRLAKLADPQFKAEIVFVGDSSLGNGIDAGHFTRLSGRASVNLALNAPFGFAGTANMIERAAQHPSVRTVIVFQALDMMSRPASPLGDLRTRPTTSFGPGDWLGLLRAYFDWRMIQATLTGLWRVAIGADRPRELVDDYIPQGNNPKILERELEGIGRSPLLPASVDASAVRDFQLVGEACRRNGLRCLYAHGPIYEGVCAASRPYIETVNRIATEAGLEVVTGSPVCLPRDALGDTIDHYRRGLKPEGTRAYHELLATYLAAS